MLGSLIYVGVANQQKGRPATAPAETTIAFENKSALMPPLKKYGDFGALWGDFNNDGLMDLIFMLHGGGAKMLQQQESGAFKDVSANSNLKTGDWDYPQQNDRHGGSCADFDNDGNLDLFITHGAKRGETLGIKYDELLAGNGDFTFEDITLDAGTLNQFGRGRTGAWGDYDNDGWLDLYVTNFESDNVLYRNNGDRTFSDVTPDAGLVSSHPRAVWLDYDLDGYQDLLLSWPLKLMKNTGNGAFDDVTKKAFGFTNFWAHALSVADVDNDGDVDIYTARLGRPSHMFINTSGRFKTLENNWGHVKGERQTGAALLDLDNDSDLDLLQVSSGGYYFFENRGSLDFSEAHKIGDVKPNLSEKNGDVAVADFDNDGRLDFASDNMDGHDLFRNASENHNHWLKISFSGTRNNRQGYGTKVWIRSEDGTLIAYGEYRGDNHALRSTGCGPMHFGLGEHDSVVIETTWLDGSVSRIAGVKADQHIVLTDPE